MASAKLEVEFVGTRSAEVARIFLDQITADRQPLEQLVEKVGKAGKDFNGAIGWIAERISRFKLKHDDAAGIGTFEAFETISLGIRDKRALWQALKVARRRDGRLRGLDYDRLIHRAEHQFEIANHFRPDLSEGALQGNMSSRS